MTTRGKATVDIQTLFPLADSDAELLSSVSQLRDLSLIATARYDCYSSEFPDEVRQQFEGITSEIVATGANVELALGFEVQLCPAVIDLLPHIRQLTVNRSRYLLVELPQRSWPPFVQTVLRKLVDAGITPVVVHAERCEALTVDPNRVRELRDQGCVLQISSTALIGRDGKALQHAAGQLLAMNAISLVASNSTVPANPRSLRLARLLVAGLVGREAARAIFETNPRRLLADGPLVSPAQFGVARPGIRDRVSWWSLAAVQCRTECDTWTAHAV